MPTCNSGSSGGGTKSTNKKSKLDKIENQEYQYHATTGTAIFSIYEQGLKPNRGHAGKAIYFAPSESDALEWTETSSTGGKVLMRVKTNTLKSKYGWGLLDEDESIASKKIKSSDIEIKSGSKWMTLNEFVQKRSTSYKYWKSSRKNNIL